MFVFALKSTGRVVGYTESFETFADLLLESGVVERKNIEELPQGFNDDTSQNFVLGIDSSLSEILITGNEFQEFQLVKAKFNALKVLYRAVADIRLEFSSTLDLQNQVYDIKMSEANKFKNHFKPHYTSKDFPMLEASALARGRTMYDEVEDVLQAHKKFMKVLCDSESARLTEQSKIMASKSTADLKSISANIKTNPKLKRQ